MLFAAVVTGQNNFFSTGFFYGYLKTTFGTDHVIWRTQPSRNSNSKSNRYMANQICKDRGVGIFSER